MPDSARRSLQPNNDSDRRLAGGLGNCARVKMHLMRVKAQLMRVTCFATREELSIGLVVDDGPASVIFERKVDNSFDDETVVAPNRHRRFAAACTAKLGLVRTAQQIVTKDARRRARGG